MNPVRRMRKPLAPELNASEERLIPPHPILKLLIGIENIDGRPEQMLAPHRDFASVGNTFLRIDAQMVGHRAIAGGDDHRLAVFFSDVVDSEEENSEIILVHDRKGVEIGAV